MRVKLHPKIVRSIEKLSYAAGTLLLGFFVIQLAQGEVERQDGVQAFEDSAIEYAASTSSSDPSPDSSSDSSSENTSDSSSENTFGLNNSPDTTLWAPGRVADYQASLNAELPPVLGVLEIPSVGLKLPVYQSNSEMVMDRASGIIDGMSYPHEPGNIGISGHRDGYFRSLKDVELGDTIVLQTLTGEKRFRIKTAEIVEISDTRLLQDTHDQTVTLVTCYPFYFVGHAPQRFIVTASLDTTSVNQN